MSTGVGSHPTLRRQDWWLTVVRSVWLVMALAGLIILVPELQATFETAKVACAGQSLLNCNNGQITEEAARALHGAGISLDMYAAYYVVLLLVEAVVSYAVAIALMARRSWDRMVLVAAFACLFVAIPSFQAPGGQWAGATQVLYVLTHFSAGLFLFLFPSGRFVPRWSVFLFAAYMVVNFLPSTAGWAIALYALCLVSIIALQIYRYRWVSNPLQRQQTKLVILGIGTFIGIFVIAVAAAVFDAGLDTQPIPFLLIESAVTLAALPILLSVGFAILRYRLWDVDVLINRSLVYLALSLTLAGLYIGSVIGLQALFRAITGQQSELAVAISTLIIAVLFNPLRRGIQDLIARAFYRRKYNASQVLAAFGTACRDQTDLEQLRAGLLRVVEETIQPGHVSLWLADATRESNS